VNSISVNGKRRLPVSAVESSKPSRIERCSILRRFCREYRLLIGRRGTSVRRRVFPVSLPYIMVNGSSGRCKSSVALLFVRPISCNLPSLLLNGVFNLFTSPQPQRRRQILRPRGARTYFRGAPKYGERGSASL